MNKGYANYLIRFLLFYLLRHMKRLLGYLSLAFVGACSPDKQNDTSTWPTFGHDVSNNKFSALTDINITNVAKLGEVWRFEIAQKEGVSISIL